VPNPVTNNFAGWYLLSVGSRTEAGVKYPHATSANAHIDLKN
jgi:hypothetical protein